MPYLIGVNPAEVFSTTDTSGKNFGLGDRATDHLGNEYVYVAYGTGGATVNFAVSINAAYEAIMTTSTLSLRGEQVGVAMAAASATDRGWAMIYGRTTVRTEIASVAVAMATTATAGTIDDAAGTGTKQILGLSLSTAQTGAAGLAPAILNYPSIGATN